MALYLYRCKICNNEFEESLPIANRDDPVKRGYCPSCNMDSSIERAQGCGGFVLKGSCWSKDNYSSYYGDAIK